MAWRLVDSDLRPPPFTAAADEAIALARSKGLVPNTLHFYRRDRPTVSLGYFRKAKEDLDMEFCERKDIFILRRVSGGSAIYTDPGHLIYGLVVDAQALPKSKAEAYEVVCGGIIQGLTSLGLKAEFKPVNDVLVNGMKVSGSAQLRRRGVVLQHGTVVMRNDGEAMKGALRSPKHLRVTSLVELLGSVPDVQRVKDALVEGFGHVFDTGFETQDLTRFEKENIERLVNEKYGTRDWNLRL